MVSGAAEAKEKASAAQLCIPLRLHCTYIFLLLNLVAQNGPWGSSESQRPEGPLPMFSRRGGVPDMMQL